MRKPPTRGRGKSASAGGGRAEPASFAELAAVEGIAPLPAPGPQRVPPDQPPDRTRVEPAVLREVAFSASDEDGWLQGARIGVARSRLRGLSSLPTATLDLHGLEREPARRAVTSFLRRERARGSRLVLIVVGRGRHSPGGMGVLRQHIGSWLVALGEHVLAFRTADRALGGDGAVVVLLAPPRG